MIIKILKQFGFDFSKLPSDVQEAISILSIETNGTFESDNQKLNLLDEAVFKSIKFLLPNNYIVMTTDEIIQEADSQVTNDGFNTVLREEALKHRMIAVELIINNWINSKKKQRAVS